MKKRLLLFLISLASGYTFSQIPLLNSNPAITSKVIYLDFDGQVVSATGWNSGNTINALPSTISPSDIPEIWQRVSEDYRPFDVNITTDSMRFRNAPPNKRMRVIITPTSAWYTTPAGGVAFVGSFAWGGTPGTPCWIFEDELNYDPRDIAEACSHEAGHTLSLKHQSTYDNACTKTNEYNPGQGNGVTSWAPIMGVGYYNNVTTWYNGKSTLGCNTLQYDHSNGITGITGSQFLNFLPDDVGDTYPAAKILNLSSINLLDSGIITTPTDIDAYRFTICNTRYVSFSIKPWALDTVNYRAANLDIRFQLFDAANLLLLVDTPLTKLYALKGMTLNPGSYYFTVDGGGSSNYSDYGSLGKYYVRVKATNPPALATTIITSSTICSGQTTTLSYISNGSPTQWQWTVNSTTAGTTYTTQNPSLVFNAADVYTISLLATSGTLTSCATTQTINVGALPALAVTSNTAICRGMYAQLTASGSATYNWLLGNYAGDTQIVSPVVNTTYTIIGSNGLCSNSASVTVSVTNDFTLNVTTSGSLICEGQSATITTSGATNYTINPGGFSGSVSVVSPTISTIYFIAGSNGVCDKSTTRNIIVSPAFNVHVVSSDTIFCLGKTVSLTASGALSYTVNPGGITNNPALVTPTISTTYTITGINADHCLSDTIADLITEDCQYTGIAGQTKNASVSVYPNPASDIIYISTDVAGDKIEIITIFGSIVFEKKTAVIKTTSISTAGWASGIYFVKIYFKGGEPLVEKLIIRN